MTLRQTMAEKCKVFDPSMPYFVTLTLIEWLPLFKDSRYAQIIADSLNYCSENKGLEIYAYCIMPSHIHMIIRVLEPGPGPLVRDFKKYTAFRIVEALNENNENKHLIEKFRKAAIPVSRNKNLKVWQDGYYPEVIFSNRFYFQKFNYIHMNPVKAGIVDLPEHYYYSSARNYAELSAPVGIILQSPELLTH